MKDILNRFITEQEMSDMLSEFLEPTLSLHQFKNIREHRGPCGIPDHLLLRCVSGDIVHSIALELKLKDWRQGLIQAFKYRAYVNIAYVIIDSINLQGALDNLDLFQRSNIGLASFSIDGTFKVLHSPFVDTPFSPQLSVQFSTSIMRKLNMTKHNESSLPRFLRSKLGYIDLKLMETWV